MKKFIQRIGAFLLASISIFTMGYKKVKADNTSNINLEIKFTKDNQHEEENKEKEVYENNYSKEEIERYINLVESYYKSANISKNCILMLNYPYLESLGYNFPNDINTNDLDNVMKIKNTPQGWNTLSFAFIFRGDEEETITEDWRELEKIYLTNFVEEVSKNPAIKFYPILIEENERKDAKELEDLCYSIYQEYYNSNGNVNSIRLNALILKLTALINNDNLFNNRSNGFYIVVSEILGQFRHLYTLIDFKYNQLGSNIASKIQELKNKYFYLTAYITTNKDIYDETFGEYSYHPYTSEYSLIEADYNKTISGYISKETLSQKIDKQIFDIYKIRRYYFNRINSIAKITGNNIYIGAIDVNFYYVLNNNYFKEIGLVFSDNPEEEIVYENFAKIYDLNTRILNSNYNPNSYHYGQNLQGSDYPRLIMNYSDTLISEFERQEAKKIEDIYREIISKYIHNIGISYNGGRYVGDSLGIEFLDEIKADLSDIENHINNVINSNHSESLKIVIGIITEQMNGYITRIILNQNHITDNEIFDTIERIDILANGLAGNHISNILLKYDELNQEISSKNMGRVIIYNY